MVRHRSLVVLLSLLMFWPISARSQEVEPAAPRIEVRFAETVSNGPLTGRVFVAFATSEHSEPRLQVGRYGTPFFGIDIEDLESGQTVVLDETTLGYPVSSLRDLPDGTYYVQAILSKYTRFDRSDGHTVWLHMDQWEGQDWRRSPGNLVSDVVAIDLIGGEVEISLLLNRVLPEIEMPEDTEWVKRFKMKSEILSEFWGHPIFIGATILLPKGYEQHPNVSYPTVYQHGHFSTGAPFRFQVGDAFADAWMSDGFPRVVGVTIQHPTPYFDDSYAVNSANNGPYGDAIHQELIPEIERRFRIIAEPYARVLTGGSTGGWEAVALQVFYPDFYEGTWAFAPDPLDFRNVEGINIYEDENAFYKQHEWYRVPTINTRDPETGAALLTSRQRNTMELVNGTKGRSGEQLDIWSAVFGPVGEDGYFDPLFDKATGEINPAVADYWRENYDMRHILQRDWAMLGPKLEGKLHLFVGRMDNYFLNWGVYYLEEFLESTTEPYYGGSIAYGDRGDHGWRRDAQDQLIRAMADHMERRQPVGVQAHWRY